MENAPSHSGVFSSVPLGRWVSRVRDLVGANWLVTSQSKTSWALLWFCESASTKFAVHLRYCHQPACSSAAGPWLSCVSCQPLSWKRQKYSISNWYQLASINKFWELERIIKFPTQMYVTATMLWCFLVCFFISKTICYTFTCFPH